MDDVRQLLRDAPVFRGVPRDALEASASSWLLRELPTNEVVWQQLSPGNELALLVDGGLAAFVRGREVGRIRPGELVGEATTFFEGPRAAAIVTTEPCRLLVLDRAGLRALRSTHRACYDALLERALEAMTRRVGAVNLRVARLDKGGAEPASAASSTFSRLFERFRSTPTRRPPPALPVVHALPGLAEADDELLRPLADALHPVFVEQGATLCEEGSPGDTALLLAEGRVEVFRHVRGGALTRLAELEAGSLLGTGSLILRERRNATLVASADCWVFELPRDRYRTLPPDTLRLVRESLLVTLRAQLLGANALLAALQKQAGTADVGQTLGAAAAGLAAFDGRALVHDAWALYDR